MSLNFNNLIGVAIAFGDKTVSIPNTIGLVTLGIFQNRDDSLSSSLIPPNDIIYESSNDTIATISDSGTITPHLAGEVTISVSVSEKPEIGGLIYCSVTGDSLSGYSMGCLGLTYS